MTIIIDIIFINDTIIVIIIMVIIIKWPSELLHYYY